MIPPLRATGSLFAAALNGTVPSPWPVEPAMMFSQPTSGWAVHWQTRSVFTVMEPLPPLAGTVEDGASNAIGHLEKEVGEVTVLPDEPQPASANATARMAALAA